MATRPASYALLLVLTTLPLALATSFPHRALLQTCQPSGTIAGESGSCSTENDSECCEDGQRYRTTATATVVDECDSKHGCDEEHNFEPPCANNIVDGSPAVWKVLGLDTDDGVVPVTWSDA
ncbi:hypothetical protein TRIUR3_10386 [Triticum urartu]|uniref:Uncharacterized protein n=1 Tax=Triticum urartu TaxID=4572 RepID=M7ZWK7_TRIUA|nr:hypothetical protein TRIUR3_10386 [Triticum urartu]